MAAIGNFLAGAIWIILFCGVVVFTLAIAILLLSGIVHLIAYLNKQDKLVEGRR